MGPKNIRKTKSSKDHSHKEHAASDFKAAAPPLKSLVETLAIYWLDEIREDGMKCGIDLICKKIQKRRENKATYGCWTDGRGCYRFGQGASSLFRRWLDRSRVCIVRSTVSWHVVTRTPGIECLLAEEGTGAARITETVHFPNFSAKQVRRNSLQPGAEPRSWWKYVFNHAVSTT